MTFKFSSRKNEHRDEPKFVELDFWEDRENPHLCPVVLFLALAFDDDAFELIHSPDQLSSASLAANVHEHELRFKDTLHNVPVFRSFNSPYPQCHSDERQVRGWSVSAIDNGIYSLGERAGYESRITPSCARRGAVNILDSRLIPILSLLHILG